MQEAQKFDPQTTIRLVLAAKDGNREALEALFRRHAPRVLRIAALRFGWTLNEFADYEDIAQEALLRAFKGLEGFEPHRDASSDGCFRNWLATCVESAIRDHLRRTQAKRRPRGPRFGEIVREGLSTSIFADPKNPRPSGIAMDREREEKLEQALLKLNKRYREVIDLALLCGLSSLEIAQRLHFKNEANVRLVLHRALRKLAGVLEGPQSA